MEKITRFHIGGQKLSQYKPLYNHVINQTSGLFLLDSPTGSGKSYLMGKIANEKKILILTPFIALGHNINTEVQKICSDKSISVVTGSNKIWDADIIISTYDQFVNEDISRYGFEAVFVDEPQSLIEDSFRAVMNDTFTKLTTLSRTLPVGNMSATLMDRYLAIANIVECCSGNDFVPDINIIADKQDYLDAEFFKSCNDAKLNDRLVILLRNNKQELLNYQTTLQSLNIDSVILDADHKDDPKTQILLQTQVCDSPVLLVTKAAQAGISILNGNLHCLYCQYDKGMTPESLIQLVSRVRMNQRPILNMMFVVDSDKDYSVDRFCEKWRNDKIFDIQNEMKNARKQIQLIKKFTHEWMELTTHKNVEELFRKLLSSQQLPAHLCLNDVLNDRVGQVTIAQICELRRQNFYSEAFHQLVQPVGSIIGLPSFVLNNVFDNGAISTTLSKHKLLRSEVRTFNKKMSGIYWDQLCTIGHSYNGLDNDDITPEKIDGNNKILQRFNDLYKLASLDHASKNDYKKLRVINCNAKKYTQIGRLMVKDWDRFIDLSNTQWLNNLYGKPILQSEFKKNN